MAHAAGSGMGRDVQRRRRAGAFYTPPRAATAIARLALRPHLENGDPALLRVLDPACGDGALLQAAAEEIAARGGITPRDAVRRCVVGVDVDPTAVRACRERLAGLGDDAPRGREPSSRARPRVRTGDSLRAWARSDARGWDVVLGNPPYLFGEHRPRVDASKFALTKGSWDASWLFLERAMRGSRPGATVAMILPESVAIRTATAHVRRFVLERAARIDLVWLGQVFDAGISPIAWVIRKGTARSPEVHGWQLGGRGLEARPVPSAFWRGADADDCAPGARRGGTSVAPGNARSGDATGGARSRRGPGGRAALVPLQEIATIQIGEVEGKRSLRRLSPGEAKGAGPADRAASVFPALTGDSPRGAARQAEPTHDLGHAPRKSRERYAAPKVLIVKTGRTLRVGIDRHGHPTLQSVYCLHVRPSARAAGWTEARLARALSDPALSERHIRPHTEGKDVFPQITITMLREVMLPARWTPAPRRGA